MLKNEKTALEERKSMIENDLKQSAAREVKAAQTIKNIHTRLETFESEKSFLEESMKELGNDLQEKHQEIESKKAQIEVITDQLSHYKHEYDVSVKRLKEARGDFQRCHEKEADVKDRFVKCKRQTEDANNKLMAKIAEIVDLLRRIKRMEKKNRELKRDLEQCDVVLNATREEVKIFRLETKNQKEALRENDAQFVKMKNQMDKILRERDLIANQMFRRTDENELLGNEVMLLKMTIERGNGAYNERLDDIKIMTNEIKSLRSQCNILKRGLENTTDMRHEILQLHRKLNQERNKAKVLEQDFVTPMNVHRWRKLNHFDPKRSDIVKKCQRLQRHSLTQSVRIAKSDEVIQAMKRQIEVLEKEVAKRSDLAVHEKLLFTRVS